jgi:cellulose synthase/poly-beta-1,6-N-acetylglucosamine synthase-like glycosyltransferase
MEKPIENVLGFITVLPGAFSSYRWDALNQPEVLWEFYFKFLRTG